MSNPPPRYDPQTGRPLNETPGLKPGVVVLIALVAAAIGLGAGALAFGGDDNTKTRTTDSVVTEPGRTEVTVKSTPAQTVTQTETVTVSTTDDNGGSTP
jgi:hypothetical protein